MKPVEGNLHTLDQPLERIKYLKPLGVDTPGRMAHKIIGRGRLIGVIETEGAVIRGTRS